MLNWEMELKRWCPSFKILTYYGAQKERKLKRQVCSSMWTPPFPCPSTSFSFRLFPQMSFFLSPFCCFILLLGLCFLLTWFLSRKDLTPFFFPPHHLLLSSDTSGLDQAQCLPCMYHILQAGAAGPPGLSSQELALSHSGWGSEHQELQVTALAVTAQLQQVEMEMGFHGRVDLVWRVGCSESWELADHPPS